MQCGRSKCIPEGGGEKEKEMEMEMETEKSLNKGRTARDSPEQGANLVSAGVRGECSNIPYYTEYLD
jgi:hypothetical protein